MSDARAAGDRYARSLALFDRARRVIPGGIYGHASPALLAPGAAPYYMARAEGARYWDVDGNAYLDLMCGYGPVILGYQHPEVEAAAERQRRSGDAGNHPAPMMVELAERLVALIDLADWAVFGKSGSDMTTWAVRVAREHTRRRTILRVDGAYHGLGSWCAPGRAGLIPEDAAQDHVSLERQRAFRCARGPARAGGAATAGRGLRCAAARPHALQQPAAGARAAGVPGPPAPLPGGERPLVLGPPRGGHDEASAAARLGDAPPRPPSQARGHGGCRPRRRAHPGPPVDARDLRSGRAGDREPRRATPRDREPAPCLSPEPGRPRARGRPDRRHPPVARRDRCPRGRGAVGRGAAGLGPSRPTDAADAGRHRARHPAQRQELAGGDAAQLQSPPAHGRAPLGASQLHRRSVRPRLL